MRKRTYRAVAVKQVDVRRLVAQAQERLILGCDAAKEVWYGAWMNARGDVLQTIRWDLVQETDAVVRRLEQLRQAGLAVEVARASSLPDSKREDSLLHLKREHVFGELGPI